jgi:serine protease inhibitor
MENYSEINKNDKNESMKNAKLFNRNFQNINNKRKDYYSNIDRLCLERDFEKSSIGSDASDASGDNLVGEITGNEVKSDKYNKGMPMRSQYAPKKEMYDANKYLDFNLYNEKPSKTKVGYNESNNYSSFAELNTSMTPMTQQINPMYILSNSVEKFGSRMFDYMSDVLQNNNFIVCTFGLYTLFSSLYLVSNNITENECKKFFNLPNKNLLEMSLSKLTKTMESISDMIKVKNLFIYGNNITHNKDVLKTISQFCTVACVNIQDPEGQATKLTYIINKLMETKMRNPITPSNIANLQIMFMTTAIVKPIWLNSFDRIAKGLFFGHDREIKQNYLVSHDKVFSYFEDNEHQLIEIKCGQAFKGNVKLMFGILLHKKNQTSETNEKLHFYIEHAKETSLEEVRIPMFTQDLKFRYNNAFKKMGLNSVFHKITANELFPEGTVILHDIIQNVKIIIDDASFETSDNNPKGAHSIRKFIADKPFYYYFRFVPTNTILFNGTYV